MTSMTLIREAASVMREALGQAKRPALLLSGGKESVLLLYILLRELHWKPECVFWHEDFDGQMNRTAYVKWLALENDLTITNWPPMWRGHCVTDTGVDILAGYDVAGALLMVATETIDVGFPSGPCYQMWMQAATERFPFCPYDLLVHGGRETDNHPTLGIAVPAAEQVLGHIKLVHPLFGWSEVDVWEAIRMMDIPYDKERYDNGGVSPDKVRMCARCVDRSRTGQVYCGMLKREIPYGSLESVRQITKGPDARDI